MPRCASTPSGACTPRSPDGPSRRSRSPGADRHARFPAVIAVAAYGRFARGDLEEAIELGDRAVAAAEELGVDSSGLAERTLGNAWFYLNETTVGTDWMDRMIASARDGSAARLTHALYMRSVAHTSLGDRVKGAQFAGEALGCGRRPADHRRPGPRRSTRSGWRSSRPTRSKRRPTSSSPPTSPRDAGNRWIQAFALTEVLWLRAREGEPREALAGYADVVEIWYRGGDWANQWLSLRHVFAILVQLQAHLGAATLHGALTAAGTAYALPFEASEAERITSLVDGAARSPRRGHRSPPRSAAARASTTARSSTSCSSRSGPWAARASTRDELAG